jgi:hypothetical protein
LSTVYLPVGSALFVDTSTTDTPTWQKLTEHNRSPISLDITRIEQNLRTSNGTLRKLFIADKRTFNTSWSILPALSTMTVDGGWGAREMRDFYLGDKGKNSFKLKLSYNGVTTEDNIVVSFQSANFSIVKRNVKAKSTDTPQEFWDVTISLEEV